MSCDKERIPTKKIGAVSGKASGAQYVYEVLARF